MVAEKLIVRGKFRGADPNFSGLMHSVSDNSVGIVDLVDGCVAGRTTIPANDTASIARHVETVYQGTRVQVDDRDDADLVPLATNPKCEPLDFVKYRRAKSVDERDAVASLEEHARRLLQTDANEETAFRGTMSDEKGLESAYQVRHGNGFTEYRGCFRDARGMVSDLTEVKPDNEDWRYRCARADRAFRAVEDEIRVGASVKDIDDVFMGHLDLEKDVVYGSTLRHTGYLHHEDLPLDTLQPGDLYKVGAAIGDRQTGEVALFYRGSKFVPEAASPGAPVSVARVAAVEEHFTFVSPPV